MKIATLNIDWAKTYKVNNNLNPITELLNNHDADILVVTEAVELSLNNYRYIYKTEPIPFNGEYQKLDYFKRLKGHPAYRVIIYSKYQSVKHFDVKDDITSVCKTFDTPIGLLTVYGTIIGTWFTKHIDYAKKELNNCIQDCLTISKKTDLFCLVGDLNTTFSESKRQIQVLKNGREEIESLCKSCNLDLTTNIDGQIDHILISQSLIQKYSPISKIVIPNGELTDHPGILLQIE